MLSKVLRCCQFATPFLLMSTIADAGVNITLTSGKILHADRIEQNSASNEVVLILERDGIVLRKYLSALDVSDVAVADSPSQTQRLASSQASPQLFQQVQPNTAGAVPIEPALEAVNSPCLQNGMPISGFVPGVPLAPQNPKQFAGWPPSGVVVGIRQDPLAAYSRSLSQVYPEGVPQLEAGFARELMRNQNAYQIAPPWSYPLGTNWQGVTNPGYHPLPR